MLRVVVSEFCRRNYKFFLGLSVLGILCYAMMMIHQTTNTFDGLWFGSYSEAGLWELSTGRWFWIYVDKMHFGIAPDPMTNVISILCFVLALVMILDIFTTRQNWIAALICSLALVTSSVGSKMSYRFQSNAFALATLLAVLGFWIAVKIKHILADVLTIICIAFSLGCYQNDIGVTCLLVCAYVIFMTYHNTERKEILIYIRRMFIDGALGCLVYWIELEYLLKKYDVKMSSYQGFSTFDISLFFSKIPKTLIQTYKYVYDYFNYNLIKISMLGNKGKVLYAFTWVIIITILVFMGIKIFKQDKINFCLFLLSLTFLPIATNIITVVAYESFVQPHMSLNIAYMYIVLLIIVTGFEIPESIANKKVTSRVISVTSMTFVISVAVLLFGQLYQVQCDEMAMREGQKWSADLAGDVLNYVKNTGLLAEDTHLVLIGSPVNNSKFHKTIYFDQANKYAQFGNFMPMPGRMYESWLKLYQYELNRNINIGDPYLWENIYGRSFSENLDEFPGDGCYAYTGNDLIVKVSDI